MHRGVLTTLLALSVLGGCGRAPAVRKAELLHLSGATMGTTWSVKLPMGPDAETLRSAIEVELAQVNREMSHYDPESELSRFGRSAAGAWFEVSSSFATVVELSLAVGQRSGGALDVTLAPLIDLWGFGPRGPRTKAPTDEEIAAAQARCGLRHLVARGTPPGLRKDLPDLRLDLSAVAKGHGVDRVGSLLSDRGLTSWFVEIGGEVAARGRKPDGEPWRVAIELPTEAQRATHRTLALEGLAIATSGDYRNFFRDRGRKYSHTLDPRTGRPVTHDLASVSVLAATCAEADAWATAIDVLGPRDGLACAEREGVAALLLVRTESGLVEATSSAFRAIVPAP